MSTPEPHVDEQLQTEPASSLAAEADAIPIPEGDNLSADRPGESADTAAAAPAGELTEDQARAIAVKHRPIVGFGVNFIADTAVPLWKITEGEREQLVDAGSLALAYWWPDGEIPGKWAALLMVGYVGWQIANSRRDANGNLMPARAVTVRRTAGTATGSTASPDKAAAEAQAIAGATSSASPGGFSTSA